MRYRRKDQIVEAVQWFRLGDSPDVVRKLHRPRVWEAFFPCKSCGHPLSAHGSFGGRGDHVCPGDYLVTIGALTMPFPPRDFERLYDPIP